jgi:hypothetical protein
MARRRKLISEAEYNQILQQREVQRSKQTRGSRRNRVIEPNYDDMSLDEFGGHVQATSQECMELGISSGFAAARAFDRGDYVTGTVKTCESVVGVVSVIAIVAQLLGAASGRD